MGVSRFRGSAHHSLDGNKKIKREATLKHRCPVSAKLTPFDAGVTCSLRQKRTMPTSI